MIIAERCDTGEEAH